MVVLASDLAVDARPFLSHRNDNSEIEEEEHEDSWHDCSQHLSPDEDFSDLDLLQFLRLQGSDKNANRILRIVGKYYPGMHYSFFFRVFDCACFEGVFYEVGFRLLI